MAEISEQELARAYRVAREAIADLRAADNRDKRRTAVEPRYLDKFALAQMASPQVLACRADLREALEMAKNATQDDA
jgi:hypothetical protein